MRREPETERCCGTCRFHKKQGWNPKEAIYEWDCTCEDAEEYAMETGYNHGRNCPEWEGR